MKKVILAVTLVLGSIGMSYADQCHVEMRLDPYGHPYYVQVCTR
jgi:hypothetical protein